MRLASARRGGAMPAILREVVLRPRHAMNDPAFRNCIKMGVDAAAALTELATRGGELRLPDQGEVIHLATRPTLISNGLFLRGCPSQGDYGTVIKLAGVGAGIDFSGGDETGIDGAYVTRHPSIIPTSNAAIAFVRTGGGNNTYGGFARNIRIDQCFNGIDVSGATNTRLESKIELRDLYGFSGVRYIGSSGSERSDNLRVENLICDAPYSYSATALNWRGSRATSTAYSQGDTYISGGAIYQITTAGTTSSGSGPNGSVGTAGSRLITDGTAVVQFMCSSSLTWLLQESYAYTLDVVDSKLINGAYGFRALDSVNSGASYPIGHYLSKVLCEHNAFSGISLDAGEDCNVTQCRVTSSMSGNGIRFGVNYRGEGGVFGSNIRKNAESGISHDTGRGMTFEGNAYVDNSQKANNTYANHTVGSNVTGFMITNSRFLPETGQNSQRPNYPVVINSGCDGYIVDNLICRGHQTAGTVSGSSGSNKYIGTVVGF